MSRLVNIVAWVAFLLFLNVQLNAQASWEKFGQNRVQYGKFEWNYFDSTHFRVFYYSTGKAHANYCINIAEQELQTILDLMGGRLYKKLNIVIYNSFGDYKQTNLGRKNDEFNAANGGMVTVLGENIPVYFNGDHLNLRIQILKGITSIMKDELIYGSTLKEVLKSSIQMNLPEWYTNGYITYISDAWTVSKDDEVRNFLLNNRKQRFEDVAFSKPELIGHSFWNFIEKVNGAGTISTMIYVTRNKRNVNKTIELVLKKTIKELFVEWKQYYLNRSAQTLALDSIKQRIQVGVIKEKKGSLYSQFTMSPTGRELAFVEKRDGQFFVYLLDIKYNKLNKILEGGLRTWSEMADPDYPLLTWSGSGKKMAILYQRNRSLFIRTYISGQGRMINKLVPANRAERITSLCFTPDENLLAITGIKKGQSDLMYLTLKNNRVDNITKDLYDDKQPVLNAQGINNGILFLSNRNSPYLGENSKSDDFNEYFNLFLYRPAKGTNLLQLTHAQSPILNPIPWGEEDFAYMQEERGVMVRKIIHIAQKNEGGDTIVMKKSAPLPFVPIKQDYIQSGQKVVEIIRKGNAFIIFSTPFDSLNQENLRYEAEHALDTAAITEVNPEVQDSLVEYLTPFNDQSSSEELDNTFLQKKVNASRFLMYSESVNAQKPKKYLLNFYADNLQTTLDNTLLFTRYEPYGPNQGVFQNPPVSGFITASLNDIMEDYKLIGGGRLGSDFNSIDYFVKFNNYRRRTDWGLLFFHNSTKRIIDLLDIVPPNVPRYNSAKTTLDYIQGDVTYPLDILRSFRFSLGFRRDGIRIPSINQYTLGLENVKDYWTVSRVEYVYDNTTIPLLNIWKGTRAKVFAEYQYQVNNDKKGFYNFGYDARNYVGIYKNIILASRLAGANSGGKAKILYLLGGVDNDLSPKSDQNSIADTNQTYAFQSLATNLRGYRQGFRKGSSYLVWNEEIRIPIMNTFSNRYIHNGFLRYLQLVFFADMGTSWNGIIPTSENIRIPSIVPGTPVTVIIDNGRYDFGLGYGAGLRTKILGYFLRTDLAWSVDAKRKPILQVSLATDF